MNYFSSYYANVGDLCEFSFLVLGDGDADYSSRMSK